MNLSTIRYHLNFLERNGILSTKDSQNKKVYFIKGKVDSRDKNTIALLQQKRFRRIFINLILKPNQTQKELAQTLTIHRSTLSKYLKYVTQFDLLKISHEGKEKRYDISNKSHFLHVLFSYKRSFRDKLVDRILKIYFSK